MKTLAQKPSVAAWRSDFESEAVVAAESRKTDSRARSWPVLANTILVALTRIRPKDFSYRLKNFLARPQFRGKRFRVFILRLWWELRRKILKNPPSARLNEGTRIWLLPDPGCFGLYATGFSEREISEFIHSYLKPGMTFVDVGSYVGEHCVRASRIVGDRGRVYAFEPIPATFEVLMRNIYSNRLRNVLCERIALSDRCGEAAYEHRLYPDGSGLARVAENHEINKINPVLWTRTVNTMSLDEYARKKDLLAIDLLKLDVEGAELKVLRGSRGILSSFGPALVFEFDTRLMATYDFRPTDVLSFLSALGYRLFLLRTEAPGLVFTPFQLPRGLDMRANLIALKDNDARLKNFLPEPSR